MVGEGVWLLKSFSAGCVENTTYDVELSKGINGRSFVSTEERRNKLTFAPKPVIVSVDSAALLYLLFSKNLEDWRFFN